MTQFGAFVETLPPGSASSIKHWHAKEDEMIYVLDGIATVVEGDEEHQLSPGDAATFKAGAPLGHCVKNNSDQSITYLVIGSRKEADTVTFPDNDRVLHFTRDDTGETAERRFETLQGAPATNPYVIDDSAT